VIERRAFLPGLRVETAPQGSMLGPGASAHWLPPRLRLRPDGDGVLIAGTVLHRLVGNDFTGVLEVGRADDAMADGDGAWVLEGRALRRVPDGAGPEGAWERLLADASTTYAVERRPATVLAALPDGARRELGPAGLDPVVDAAGRVAWVQAGGQWVVDGKAVALAPGAEGVPIGLDDDGRGYLARATGVTAIEPDGSIAWSFGPEGIVPGPDGSVLTAHDVDFTPPDVGRPVAWRLIAPDLMWGGEGARGPGVLVRISTGEVTDPAPSRLEGWWPLAARDWQVDRTGGVHLTLAGPDGVHVVTIRG